MHHCVFSHCPVERQIYNVSNLILLRILLLIQLQTMLQKILQIVIYIYVVYHVDKSLELELLGQTVCAVVILRDVAKLSPKCFPNLRPNVEERLFV